MSTRLFTFERSLNWLRLPVRTKWGLPRGQCLWTEARGEEDSARMDLFRFERGPLIEKYFVPFTPNDQVSFELMRGSLKWWLFLQFPVEINRELWRQECVGKKGAKSREVFAKGCSAFPKIPPKSVFFNYQSNVMKFGKIIDYRKGLTFSEITKLGHFKLRTIKMKTLKVCTQFFGTLHH